MSDKIIENNQVTIMGVIYPGLHIATRRNSGESFIWQMCW